MTTLAKIGWGAEFHLHDGTAPGIEGPEDSGSQENDVYVYRARLEFLVWHARI